MKKSGYIVGEFRGDIVGTHTHINPYKSATFDTQIKDVLEKRKDSEFKRIIISSTPDLIINLGLDADNVSVKKSVVLHHSRKTGHLSTAEEWICVANNLDIPIAYRKEDENKYHLYYEIGEKLILVIVEKTKIGRYEDTINVVTTFYNNHNLSKDVELGLAKRINQPSER